LKQPFKNNLVISVDLYSQIVELHLYTMRIFTYFLLLSLTSCSPGYVLYVQPNDVLDLRYDYELTDVQVKNKSLKAIEVKIKDNATKETTGGFGMSPVAKVNVVINNDQYLHFVNNSSKKIPLKISPTEKKSG